MHFHSLHRCYGMALHLEPSAILSTMLHTMTLLTLVISFSCSSAELAQSTFAAMKKTDYTIKPIDNKLREHEKIYTLLYFYTYFFANG
jgi:hypothetical protein